MNDIHAGQLLAALQRIARKPINAKHTPLREFYKKGGGWITLRAGEPRFDDPLYIPTGATFENNPCDCPNCIARRVLAEIKNEVIHA